MKNVRKSIRLGNLLLEPSPMLEGYRMYYKGAFCGQLQQGTPVFISNTEETIQKEIQELVSVLEVTSEKGFS